MIRLTHDTFDKMNLSQNVDGKFSIRIKSTNPLSLNVTVAYIQFICIERFHGGCQERYIQAYNVDSLLFFLFC